MTAINKCLSASATRLNMRERYRREGGLSSLILQGFCVGAILVRRDSRQLAKPGDYTT
jgi:hypothetical protein